MREISPPNQLVERMHKEGLQSKLAGGFDEIVGSDLSSETPRKAYRAQ